MKQSPQAIDKDPVYGFSSASGNENIDFYAPWEQILETVGRKVCQTNTIPGFW